ncbi:LysE family translocator [Chitinasiproducens palmae]|uniref:Threonine/homoserine/homoserine lactone efflux protein n=1 Tax=Chitinasiproducens palmae TaxID=1770053 RepID=A0A1H2PJY8_9BURK|nr:LysE family translocator [Chitinasiproducens palmae]SDV46658.1 Threonine/homoserine/homoserine lactone efflux protein [Chitinasiproducens palmae]
MSLHDYLLFLPACFALNMVFGPNNALAIGNSVRNGVTVAVLAASGRLLAFAAMIVVAGLGLGALLAGSETLFALVKWIGAAYLVFIGIKLWRGAPAAAAAASAQQAAPPASLGRLARQEGLVAIGNPKAILIFTAFLPQFVDPNHYALSYTIVGMTFLVLEVFAIAIYAVVGLRIAKAVRGGRAFLWFNRTSGVLMMVFGAALAFARRP